MGRRYKGAALAAAIGCVLLSGCLAREERGAESVYAGVRCAAVDAAVSQEKRERLAELMREAGFVPEGIVTDIRFETLPADGNVLGGEASGCQFVNGIVCQRLDMPGYDAFKLSAVGIWNEKPLFRFDDVLALAWSGGFSLYEDEVRTIYRDIWGNPREFEEAAVLWEVAPAEGIAYGVPLFVQTPEAGYNLWYIQADAWIRTTDNSGTAAAMASYAHGRFGGDITAILDGSPGIRFSGWGIEQPALPVYCEWEY